MAKSTRIVAPYVNKFGHVIQPGDKVYAITVSTGRLQVSEAEYVGYTECKYAYSEHKRVQIRVPRLQYGFKHKQTGELLVWKPVGGWGKSNDELRQNYTHGHHAVPGKFRITTLQNNLIIPASASIGN